MLSNQSLEQIAIVGIGGIFPGAPDLETFWKNIEGGVDSGRPVPDGRWYLSAERAFDADGPQPDRVYSTWGCFIEDFHFDPAGLNVDQRLLRRLDPLCHLGLHAARAAFHDARSLQQTDRDRVGVILGNIALPTESTSAMCRDILGRTFVERLVKSATKSADDQRRLAVAIEPSCPTVGDPINRFAASLPAALIADALNLGGVAFTLDAACASSLYALKFACEELRSYRADAMLAGGMSRPDCQYTQMGFSQLKALSRQGRCAPLSDSADGLVVGEGAGVFVLKRLSDAVAANDKIYAVIAGIGLSNDRGANLLAPHSEGQLRAMRAAYAQAGWRPNDVDLIECHATGTPVGDGVEIASLQALWEHESWTAGQCVIGGVKSNVGHLLTGAGAAGLMKVLFALNHQTLPPTANFTAPAAGLAANQTPFRVISRAEPWPRRALYATSDNLSPIPRRATVNAFGFGGINAHVLIEEYSGQTDSQTIAPVKPIHLGNDPRFATTAAGCSSNSDVDIAIVGIASQVGKSQSVGDRDVQAPASAKNGPLQNDWGVTESDWFRNEFGTQLDSRQHRADAIEEVRLERGQFRIPPLEMQDMLPQQQLMLAVSAAALRDAASANDTDADARRQKTDSATSSLLNSVELGNRTGVFIGIELDPNTSNFHLRWSVEQDAATWVKRLGLNLSEPEVNQWIGQLKDSIGPPLTANRVMGNLGGIVASRLAREFNVGGPSFTISSNENSGLRACELAANALRRGELDQALVGAVDLPCDIRNQVASLRKPPRGGAPKTTCDAAVAFVLKRHEDAVRDGNRIHAVLRKIDGQDRQSADRSDQSMFNAGAATGLVSFARAVTQLSDHILHQLKRHWLRNRCEEPRQIRVPGIGADGRGLAFELTEAADAESNSQQSTSNSLRRAIAVALPARLFVIAGDSIEDLTAELNQLPHAMAGATSLVEMATRWHRSRKGTRDRHWTMTLMVKSVAELPEVIRLGIARLTSDSRDDDVDRRVQFSSEKLAPIGRLAFVFPGSGNAFVGMGRELLATFPEVLERQDAENERLKDQYRPDLIWQAESTARLLDDHKAMIFGQVALGTAVCDLLALFNVRPTASIGYSLGESAALFGLRAWTDRDDMLQRMHDATLFGSDLVRPFNAARCAWNIPENVEVDWVSGSIDRSATVIRQALSESSIASSSAQAANYPHVYLLIINTPTQCVIGGAREQVDRFVRDLKAKFVSFAAPSTVHCEILRRVEPAYRELHLMRTKVPSPEPIDIYSTAWGHSYELSRESAADAIVAQATNTVDFPKVIEQAYADGVRVFVEIGPGSSCCRMIDEILSDRPHAALAATPVTANPVTAYLEVIAALISHGVPVDLDYLYGGNTDDVPKSTVVRTADPIVSRTGGPAFVAPLPPNGWPSLAMDKQIAAEPSDRQMRSTIKHESTPMTIAEEPTSKVCRAALPVPMIHPTNDVKIEMPMTTPPPSLRRGLDGFRATAQATDGECAAQTEWMSELEQMISARSKAHETYLRVATTAQNLIADQLAILEALPVSTLEPDRRDNDWPASSGDESHLERRDAGREQNSVATDSLPAIHGDSPPRSLTRRQCMEFAIGKIGNALGERFAAIDSHPTRVRLPDEPLMLVDRILEIDGEPLSMTSGTVVTEHDIQPGAWYLDCNRIPTCIAVEAGQADLFLSGWLGIDLQTKGLACYRLLDAVVTFHDRLPSPGQTIHYAIRVNHFFRQGQTYLFRFEFDATVDGRPLLTMREGCAGFFTEEELAGGKGIVHTALDRQPRPGKRPADWLDLVPMSTEAYDDGKLLALRRGDLEGCFGGSFANLSLNRPVTIPGLVDVNRQTGHGGSDSRASAAKGVTNRSRTWLIDRVLKLDPNGGKYRIGMILGELDIRPDDWFLTCHFCDDQVMPGTLMYECCLHTLRIYLLRMGWIGEEGQIAYEPVPGIQSRLKCRGQVRANTKKVWYEITLKEIGYTEPAENSARPTNEFSASQNLETGDVPYCIADALMYADGKPIVEITDMSVRLSGLTRLSLESLWGRRPVAHDQTLVVGPPPKADFVTTARGNVHYDRRPALFDNDRITAFAIGKPSDAFGNRYQIFDSERVIARLPGPPFQFLDRIVAIDGCEPWMLKAGGEIVAQYDIPSDAWYFAANRQQRMPFAVLLETALQPCGWLAAYVGSALTSETDLSFRNLGGSAIQYQDVTPTSGTLTTTVKMTRVSNSGGMIIQHYDFDLRCDGQPVYVGNTYFGFFSKSSLANQIGIRDAKPFMLSNEELSQSDRFAYIDAAPFADSRLRTIDQINLSLTGGPEGNGFVMGTMEVDPDAWFFKAHFYQDPVVPGSLGLESFFQLLKLYAARRWQLTADAQFVTPVVHSSSPSINPKHEWVYRGQVIPSDKRVTVSAVILNIDDANQELVADGFLSVDGRVIYQMKQFSSGVVTDR